MGMAASQARLLMITSRLHDVELKAQQLQNAKLQLSTQQDEVYEEYQKALDATTFTGNFMDASGAYSTVPITFDNLFSLGAATNESMHLAHNANYILIDKNGRVVVEDDVYDAYQDFQNGGYVQNLDNAYAFAYYMVEGQRNGHNVYNDSTNGTHTSDLQDAIKAVFMENLNELAETAQNLFDVYVTHHPNGHSTPWEYEQGDLDYALDGNGDGSIFNSLLTWAESEYTSNTLSPEETEIYNECVNYFWAKFGQKVFNKVNDNAGSNVDGDSYNKLAFDYYVNIYNAIQQHGGCIPISDFNNMNGSAANNNEWLTAMLQSGQMTIETVSVDNTGNATISGATVASETSLSYTATTSIDKVALAHAEAEYEHQLKVIDRKEQKIDRELNKIETERNALTKQYDSIKKVSDDNIDRTFGIFS